MGLSSISRLATQRFLARCLKLYVASPHILKVIPKQSGLTRYFLLVLGGLQRGMHKVRTHVFARGERPICGMEDGQRVRETRLLALSWPFQRALACSAQHEL